MLTLSSGCSSTQPTIQYIDRIVEVPIKAPPQLTEPCKVSERSGNTVRDYIISERRLRNDLAICNLVIDSRNKLEEENAKTNLDIRKSK